MEIIKEPQIDPDLNITGDALEKVNELILLLENGSIRNAKLRAHNLKGYLQAVEKYFDFSVKKRYN